MATVLPAHAVVPTVYVPTSSELKGSSMESVERRPSCCRWGKRRKPLNWRLAVP